MLWSVVGGLSGPSRHLLVSLQEKHREQASQLLSTADSAASLRFLVTAKFVTLGILRLAQCLCRGEGAMISSGLGVQSTSPYSSLLPMCRGETEAQRGHPMGADLV